MRALPIRPPALQLRHARQDHAVCLRLAASYRTRLLRGEPDLAERHAEVIEHARRLRRRFAGLSLEARAAPI